MQVVSTVYFWRLGQQVSFSKALASWNIPDTELFAIRLSIAKAISLDVEYIILITNSLSFARKVVNHSVYCKQAYSLAFCFVL